jgi:hypothetical protein
MALPHKRHTIFDNQEVTIRSLNVDEVEEMMAIGQPDADGTVPPEIAMKRMVFVVNAGIGSDFTEHRKTEQFKAYYDTLVDLNNQIMELSGFRAPATGEPLAVVENSTSSESAAA